jgi:hypothetical protein
VTGLLPILALVFLAVMVVLWAGTMFLQGYLYSEPVSQIYWRAPLAALVLTLFLAFWCSLDYRHPRHYNALFDFTARDDEKFDKFIAEKNGKEIPYAARSDAQGRTEYRDPQGKKWARSDSEGVIKAITVQTKDGQKLRFEAELIEGKFKAAQGQPVRYVEVDGEKRVMTDEYIGQVSVVRWGRVLANLFLNFAHWVVWFLCLWLLLRFQWSHALGLGLALWAVLTFILPTLFNKTEELAKRNALPPSTTAVPGLVSIVGTSCWRSTSSGASRTTSFSGATSVPAVPAVKT